MIMIIVTNLQAYDHRRRWPLWRRQNDLDPAKIGSDTDACGLRHAGSWVGAH